MNLYLTGIKNHSTLARDDTYIPSRKRFTRRVKFCGMMNDESPGWVKVNNVLQ